VNRITSDGKQYGIDNNEPIEYFYEIYNDSWHLVRWNAMSIENEKFYRARTFNKDDLFHDINESVAYLSTSER